MTEKSVRPKLTQLPWTLAVLFCLSLAPRVNATSIIVELHKDRIIVAADTRLGRLSPSTPTGRHDFHDDGCKIAILGDGVAAAVAGNMDYMRNDPSDPVPDWNALLDAKASYKNENGNLQATAADWGQRAKTHYDIFYLYAPERVRNLVGTNQERVLVDAFFTGWNREDGPTLIWEKVYLDERPFSPIRTSSQVLPIRDLPYTNDALTYELIEGNSDRTQAVKAKWQSASRRAAKREQDWRWFEFLIRSTHEYEEGVGERVNVLQIVKNRKIVWLQNLTCPN